MDSSLRWNDGEGCFQPVLERRGVRRRRGSADLKCFADKTKRNFVLAGTAGPRKNSVDEIAPISEFDKTLEIM